MTLSTGRDHGDRHTIETRVGRLAVRVAGDGPTAVLWPSLFMDERSWDRLLPSLTQDRRLVIINGPGHGASGDPGRRYSLRDCVTAASQVLDRLAIGGAVDWVGNAWGGHVGLRFAAERPAQCRSLITLGTPVAALSRSERRRTYPLLVAHAVLGPTDLVLAGVTEVLLSAHTRANDPEAVELVRDSLRHANRRMLRNAVVSISLGREDLTDLLSEIAAPTLLVTGSDHSGFTPHRLRPPPASPGTAEPLSCPTPPTLCRSRHRRPHRRSSASSGHGVRQSDPQSSRTRSKVSGHIAVEDASEVDPLARRAYTCVDSVIGVPTAEAGIAITTLSHLVNGLAGARADAHSLPRISATDALSLSAAGRLAARKAAFSRPLSQASRPTQITAS